MLQWNIEYIGEVFTIERKDRFLLLKLMNCLYSISFSENADRTQDFLEKLIYFFRYYTSEEYKLVRLKEEVSYIKLFIKILSTSTGNKTDFVFLPDFTESADIYIPSRAFLFLIRDILITDGIKSGSVILKTNEDGEKTLLILRTEIGDISTQANSSIAEVQRIFHKVCGLEVGCMVEEPEKGIWELAFILPKKEFSKG